MLPAVADRPKLRATLDHLSGAVEELVLSGLTTASDATRRAIEQTLQETARLRLLRFGATLRVLADDINRFQTNDPLLSRRRLTFFINRVWLLSRGMSHALEKQDEKEFDRLNLTPATQQLASADLVCLGVVKKVTASVVQFQFRFRAVKDAAPVKSSDSVMWSFSQPVKNKDFPPEAYLHLSQKQKFTPFHILDRKIQTVKNAVVVPDDVGGWRLVLNDQSTITPGAAFTDWSRFLNWTPAPALERLAKQTPGPLDLDTELQEEVVVRDFEIAEPVEGDEPGQTAYPVSAGRLALYGVIGAAEEKPLKKNLDELRKQNPRPPLYGLMHYERCRLVFQPLTTFGKDGPEYLTISQEKVDKGALLRDLF